MEKIFSLKAVSRALIIGLLYAPFLVLFLQLDLPVDSPTWPAAEEWGPSLWFTLKQAALSSLLSLFFGVIGALGLCAFNRRGLWLEKVTVLPAALPVLFVLNSLLYVFQPFPFGLVGISLTHAIMNSGLVALNLVRIFENKIGGMAELALVEGARKSTFLKTVVLGYLRSDLLSQFFLVFGLCLLSFAVPLTMSGGHGTTLEVLIYEKIRINNSYSQALGLVGVQISVLVLLSLFLGRTPPLKGRTEHNLSLLGFSWGIAIPGLAVALIVIPFFGAAIQGFNKWKELVPFQSVFVQAFLGTLLISLVAGVGTFLLLTVTALGLPHRTFRQVLNSYVGPGAVIAGFFFLVLTLRLRVLQGNDIWAEVGTGILIGIGSTGVFFRLRVCEAFDSLSGQYEVAQVCGANTWLIFRKIVFPQIKSVLWYCAGLSAFWASGDFIYSMIILGGDKTLGLIVQRLMNSYRLDLAALLSLILLTLGFALFLVFEQFGKWNSKCLL